MDRGAWWATDHGVTKTQTWLKRQSTDAWYASVWFSLGFCYWAFGLWFLLNKRKFTENYQNIAYHCFEYRISKTIQFSSTSLSWCSEVSISLLIFYFILFFNFTILHWFCHISTWICHGCTHVSYPEPSSLPIPSLWVIPVHQPLASSIVHWTWTGDSFHIRYYTYFNALLPNHPTLSLSHRVQKTVLYISVSSAVLFLKRIRVKLLAEKSIGLKLDRARRQSFLV